MTQGLFGPMFSTPEVTARTDRGAWLQAMLDVERALAHVQAQAGVIPDEAAQEISRHCKAELFDAASISERAVASATPVVPLVRDLTSLVAPSAAPHVHRGATSQDIIDTAAMLVIRRSLEVVSRDLRAAARESARLATEHRHTLMAARTLLQQALPTTFGRKCAGWLVALSEASAGLDRVVSERLAVQFGGPAGTLASLGTAGERVAELLAAELDLTVPTLPWHTDRGRIGELAGAMGTVSGALGKLALDVQLQAQTEVGELSEGASGGSSAMPHKRNPVVSVRITAATKRVPGLVGTLFASMPQEHERASGAWQAEWEPLVELIRLVGSAAAAGRELLTGLRVHTDQMVVNLNRTQGLLMAESASSALLRALGRAEAQELVADLCRAVVERGTSLREELLRSESVRAVLSEQDVYAATEPADHLGSAGVFIDRALAAHDAERSGE
jgi:3-carboxy-cis,cis-muconate cycloisomerase